MMREYTEEEILNMKVSNYVKKFENAKEQQLIELIIEILVESIMKEYHEESNQIFAI
jgi:flagellar biosynthesis/type III secretory pathway protein FliH